MTYIVEQVGGKYVEAINLVPPNQHPGNFDMKPSDVEKLATARVFLLHGWPGETYVDKLVEAANNPNLEVIRATVDGNWMIPQYQSAAVDKVLAVLIQIDAEHTAAYEKNAAAYKSRIAQKETEIKNRLAASNASDISVIASLRQADFLTWAGFKVMATFTSPNTMTPQVTADLIAKGKENNVTIVVNNIQDGQDAGKAVAADLGAANLNLSNFPGGFANTETWEKAIDYNVTLLLEAIK